MKCEGRGREQYLYLYLPLSSSVPDKIVPTHSLDGETNITIAWNSSSSDVVRYIVNVRQYFSDGVGKVRVAGIAGYPLEVPGTVLQHVVASLSEPLRAHGVSASLPPSPAPLPPTEPLVPYDVQLVAGSVAGCGEPVTSQPFFTKEGGMCSHSTVHSPLCSPLHCVVHSSSETSSRCEGGATERHSHERLIHQTQYRGGSQR